jgi:hypothetical protein
VACSEGCHQGLQLRRWGRLGSCLPPVPQRGPWGCQARTARSARGHDGGAAAPGPLSPRPGPAAKSPDRAAGDRPNQASQQKQNAQLTRAWWRRMEPQAATGRGQRRGQRGRPPIVTRLARFTPSSAWKAFAVLSPYVRRSHIRTLRTSAAVSQQCEVTQVKVAVTSPDHVGTVTAAPTGPFPGA